ncbi:MAG: 1-acyl-sn-glycerol-3-phosphate acyltransferase [Firmicutes bacterium]|nr:1-acyl-sn-glycerol-3-phosphate acyltransferase [Bacillota bacterium]
MLYWFVRFVFGIVFRLIYRQRVYGRELLPERGPLIICSNHINWRDPIAVGIALPLRYKIKFMAKKELFHNPVMAFLLKRAAFPVDREKADFGAIRRAFKILKEGGVIGLFPEGTRSKTGKLQKLQEGTALIAGRSGAPVLPVLVVGPYRIGHPLRIIIGPTFHIPNLDYRKREERKAQLEAANRIILENLKALDPAAGDE